jgi:hypothetical protein
VDELGLLSSTSASMSTSMSTSMSSMESDWNKKRNYDKKTQLP